MRRWVLIAWLGVAVGILLAGCGQKGPLYLPAPAAPPPHPDQTQ
jgi:predicted small lipoprotein YifL